jgi:hypothetical protein
MELEKEVKKGEDEMVNLEQGGAHLKGKRIDVMDYLAKRLGEERSTMASYAASRKHINDQAFHVLIGTDTTKAFLERIRPRKAALIKSLRKTDISDASLPSED